MENFKLDIGYINDFVSEAEIKYFEKETEIYNNALIEKTGAGNDFLGWVSLPSAVTEAELLEIEKTAETLKNSAEVVVVIGIGGSYLGAKAVIEALSGNFDNYKKNRTFPQIVFAGQNISEDYLFELREFLQPKQFALVVISKSGTTTEPAIAFRILKNDLESKYGKKEAKNRIVAITDKAKGALRELADEEGYKTFIIPDDVGGRYSVFTPVGLLPIACAGFNIRQIIAGAIEMEQKTSTNIPFEKNPAAIYAAARNALYIKGKTNEILVNYNPKLNYISEWWKQLYGESEGKEGKGIFPASVGFTTDLHSMGQYIQDGIRNIFETVITVEKAKYTLPIPTDTENKDKLNFIAGKRIEEVNKMAQLGTMFAHIDGGVPNIKIEIAEINEYNIGLLLQFFMKACGISGYILKVNPFDQPGVEAYKSNMFALLGKPGFEKETEELRKRIG